MARKQSQFVGPFDIASNVFKALANAVIDAGGSDDHLRRIETDKTLRMDLARRIVDGADVTKEILVDYARSIADGKRAGGYDWANDDISDEHFPRQDGEPNATAPVKFDYLHLDCDASTEDVEREIEKRGFRSATIRELLAWGERHSEEQRKYPVVALGSSWLHPVRCRHVACLVGYGGVRGLDLSWTDDDWFRHCRFLVVRK